MVYAKSISVLIEILLFIGCVEIRLVKRGYRISEALCFSILLCLTFYSIAIQFFLLSGIAGRFFLTDLAVFIFSFHTLASNRDIPGDILHRTGSFLTEHREFLILFVPVYIYLSAQALLLPPGNYDSMTYNLSRVLMMNEENRLFTLNYTTLRQVTFPLGYDILHFLFLRFNSDLFLPIFSFLSYTAVVTGIFALTGKIDEFKNRPELPLTTALFVSSLKLLVLQATTTKNDIPTAAAAVACMAASHNFIYGRDRLSFLILCTLIITGMSFKGYFAGFALPFTLFSLLLFIINHSVRDLFSLIRPSKGFHPLLLLPLSALFFLSLFFMQNIMNFGGIFGDEAFVRTHINPDGIFGALANAARYTAQTLEYPAFLGGELLDKLHDNLLGEHAGIGALDRVRISSIRMPFEDVSWAGPLGFFIILPALFYALIRAKGFIRLSALSLWFFFGMICWKLIWTQWSSRFLSLFFAGSGISTAFLIRRFRRGSTRCLLLFSFLILIFSALFNVAKPFFNMHEIGYLMNTHIATVGTFREKSRDGFVYPGPLIFNWFLQVRERNYHYSRYFEFDVMEKYENLIPENASVLILAGRNTWIFPFLLHRKDLRKVCTSPERIVLGSRILSIRNGDHKKILYDSFDYLILAGTPEYKEMVEQELLFVHHLDKRPDAAFYLFKVGKDTRTPTAPSGAKVMKPFRSRLAGRKTEEDVQIKCNAA